MTEATNSYLDPIAFRLGGLSIHWYAIFIVGGAAIAVWIASMEAKRIGEDSENILDYVLIGLPMAIVGARLYYVLFNLPYYLTRPPHEMLAVWNGGLAIYGGLIGGIATLYYVAKKKKFSFLKYLDIMAPSVLFGQAAGRWGNFFNHEAHGGEVSREFLADTLHLPNFIVENMNINGVYYHPTFLYESVWNLIGFAILMILRLKPGRFKEGQIISLMLAWYSFIRFFLEGMRTDSLYLFGNIRVSQVLSFVLFFAAIAAFVRFGKNKDYFEGKN